MSPYRELMKRYHPDINQGNLFAIQVAKVLNILKSNNDYQGIENLYYRLK